MVESLSGVRKRERGSSLSVTATPTGKISRDASTLAQPGDKG